MNERCGNNRNDRIAGNKAGESPHIKNGGRYNEKADGTAAGTGHGDEPCGLRRTEDQRKPGDAASGDATPPAEITYAVEAGSAGEEVAQANGFKTVAVGSQANALMEVGCRHR